MNSDKHFSRRDVQLINRQTLYQGFLQLEVLTLQHPLFDGGQSQALQREVVNNRDAVGVLLYDPNIDSVALVEQFRVGAYASGEQQPWLLEPVAGIVEAGESAAQVARRESLEEANCDVEELELIAEYYSSPGSSRQKFTMYCGICDLGSAGGVFGLLDEGEDIRVQVLSSKELFKRMNDAQISNANTLIAAQWLQMNHVRLLNVSR